MDNKRGRRRARADAAHAVDKLLTVPQAAEVLNAREGFVRRLLFERKLRHVKLGRLVRIPMSAIHAYLDENTVESS
jgi:excisionase family DNA binding protein